MPLSIFFESGWYIKLCSSIVASSREDFFFDKMRFICNHVETRTLRNMTDTKIKNFMTILRRLGRYDTRFINHDNIIIELNKCGFSNITRNIIVMQTLQDMLQCNILAYKK